MDLITTTSELAATCERLGRHPFVTIDTEFLRETTYYPLLCVAQLASSDEAVVRHIGVELPKNPQLQAIIAADKAVPHGDVIHVIDLVKRSGVHKFAISTDREPAGR